jgi:maleate isomerase
MDCDSERCAVELADADVDVLAYACLIAIMAQGEGYHRRSEEKLYAAAKASANLDAPVISSAGALVEALHHLGAKKVSIITPYVPALTEVVCDYIHTEGIEVHDTISLGVADNLAVGRLDPAHLTELAHKIDTNGVDALVLSACVQMPSLPAVQIVQDQFDIPVLSASVATVWKMLKVLGLETVVPRAGALLAGS